MCVAPDIANLKRLPKEFDSLLLTICTCVQQQYGYLPNTVMEKLAKGTPFQTTSLKAKFNKLKLEESPVILKYQKLVQKYVKTIKSEIAAQVDSKDNTVSEDWSFKWSEKLEMLVYAIIYSKESLIKQQGSRYLLKKCRIVF